MNNIDKFYKALFILKPNVEATVFGEINTEEDFNKVEWKTGEDDKGNAIITIICPHAELSWSAVNTEMNRIQAEYDAQDYARKREGEYPSTKDFMEAYTEKEIGGDSTKWDAYVINYNKVRTENPK